MVLSILERPAVSLINKFPLGKFWDNSSSKSPIGEGCEYCMPDEKGNTTKLDHWCFERTDPKSYEAGEAQINPTDSTLWYSTSTPETVISSRFKINFCPHCGADLRGIQ